MSARVAAYITTELNDRIDCLFNPAELTIAKSNQWNASKAPGKDAPTLQFQQGQSGTLTMSLTFDTTDTGSAVTEHTDKLLNLMKVDASLPGTNRSNNSGRPPWCTFHWGDVHSFKAIVERLQLKFTYFSSEGAPLRAQADLTLKQFEDEESWGPMNPTSITPHPHSVHHVRPGETLDRIAAVRYGKPDRWRLIAEANRVLDPLTITPGTPLLLPDLEGAPRG
jgi:Contractile injection system tube protein